MITTDALGFVYVDGKKVCRLDREKGILQFQNKSQFKLPGQEFIEIAAQDFIAFLQAPHNFVVAGRPGEWEANRKGAKR